MISQQEEYGLRDQENLTADEKQKRQHHLEKLIQATSQWLDQYFFPTDERGRISALKPLVEYLSQEHQADIDPIVALFSGYERYIDRPVLRLAGGYINAGPDLWLLGWRNSDPERSADQTYIHDHVGSQSAVHVYQGQIGEWQYFVNWDQWQDIQELSLETWQKKQLSLPYTKHLRVLQEKQTYPLPAPYIHIIGDEASTELAVTIHAYYPPLNIMNYFQEAPGQALIKMTSPERNDEFTQVI